MLLVSEPQYRSISLDGWVMSSGFFFCCRAAARREAQSEHKADVLAEENASLILELDARPTAKQYKSLQRQMDILERKLNESKHAQE